MDVNQALVELQREIVKVGEVIAKTAEDIAEVGGEIKAAKLAKDKDEVRALRKKEELLMKKEEQLMKKEEQLMKKEELLMKKEEQLRKEGARWCPTLNTQASEDSAESPRLCCFFFSSGPGCHCSCSLGATTSAPRHGWRERRRAVPRRRRRVVPRGDPALDPALGPDPEQGAPGAQACAAGVPTRRPG